MKHMNRCHQKNVLVFEDYTSGYSEIADAFIDEDAKRFTGCDDGFDEYYRYWVNEPETKLGENFWAKVIVCGGEPIGVIALGLSGDTFTISEFIIKPEKRGRGFGALSLAQLLDDSENIIGKRIDDAVAVIFPNNIASQRVFEKVGFFFTSEHPDGDARYYRYHRNDKII